MPLGQLPVYTTAEGDILVLSNTIGRYVAKNFGKLLNCFAFIVTLSQLSPFHSLQIYANHKNLYFDKKFLHPPRQKFRLIYLFGATKYSKITQAHNFG